MTLGDKLAKLRKEHNYTQEEFAELLGVTRQAVSRWESDIAYPETDRLIKLSELYGCSIDYLLKDNAETGPFDGQRVPENTEAQTEDGQADADADESDNADRSSSKREKIMSAVTGATVLSVVAVYLALGLAAGLWHPSWIIFFLIPIIPSLADAILKKRATHFAYPLLAVAVYLLIGLVVGNWHPSWIIFLTIPIYHIIAGAISSNVGKK